MAAEEDDMIDCRGEDCTRPEEGRCYYQPKLYHKRDIRIITYSFNGEIIPQHFCVKCFEKQTCKSQCSLCSVWIRQEDDMIEYDRKDFCTYCIESLRGEYPFRKKMKDEMASMRDYLEGNRSNKTLTTMDKLMKDAIMLSNLKEKIERDPRKKRIYDMLIYVNKLECLERYQFVDELTEAQLDLLGDGSATSLKDIMIKLLK
jgi:hypothetical protein